MQKQAGSEVNNVNDWFSNDKLSLNINNINFMFFPNCLMVKCLTVDNTPTERGCVK